MKSTSVGQLSPEFALLGLLAQGPAHGYELHQRLSHDLDQIWHLSQSQVYNILNRLEGKGYILGTVHEQQKLPAKRSFELTGRGREHFEQWLLEPSRTSVRAIRVEFSTRLYFALARSSQLAAQLITEQLAATKRGLDQLIKMQATIPEDQVFNRLGLDLRIRQLGSILEWLDSCLVLTSRNSQQVQQK